MPQSFLQFARSRLHLFQGRTGVPDLHPEAEAAVDFAAPMGESPVLSHAHLDIAALCPDLVHEAERGLGRHI